MAYILPEAWDKGAFIEDISCHTELYDIVHDHYSNNEHHHSIF